MRGHEVHCGHHPEFTDTCTECQAARQAWMNAPLGRDPMFIGYTTAALTEMRVTALATAPLPHEHSTLYKDLAERIEREIVRRHPTFAADLQGDSLGVIRRWRLVYGDGSVSLWMSGSDAPDVPDDAVERVEYEYFVPASQLRGAVEALRKYGVHRSDCAARRANWKADQPAPCDCGLDAAIGGQ